MEGRGGEVEGSGMIIRDYITPVPCPQLDKRLAVSLAGEMM